MIDEVRVWDRALSPEHIRNDMDKVMAGTAPGLVGYWNFDDTTRTVLHRLAHLLQPIHSRPNHGDVLDIGSGCDPTLEPTPRRYRII